MLMICKCTGAQQKCYRGFASALERCNISLDDGLLNKKTSAWVILISLFDDMWAQTKNNGFPTCLEHCTSESKTLHSGRQWNVFPILCWSTFRIGTRITSSSFGWCYLCDSYTCKAIARQSIQKNVSNRQYISEHGNSPSASRRPRKSPQTTCMGLYMYIHILECWSTAGVQRSNAEAHASET